MYGYTICFYRCKYPFSLKICELPVGLWCKHSTFEQKTEIRIDKNRGYIDTNNFSILSTNLHLYLFMPNS